MIKGFCAIWFFILMICIVNFAWPAETFVFQFGLEGYEKTADTHITEYSGNSGNNMGANVENECCEYDPANADGKSMLVWFNVSEIRKWSPVSKASLELYMTQNRNGGNKKSVGAYQILKIWHEAEGSGVGIDGVAAKETEVCGKWTGMGDIWDKAGADDPDKDFVANANDIIEISGDTGKWYSWNIVKMAQFWINNPDKNFGVILIEPRPHAKTTGTKVFASKENSNQDIHPKLTIAVSALFVEPGSLASSWGKIKAE